MGGLLKCGDADAIHLLNPFTSVLLHETDTAAQMPHTSLRGLVLTSSARSV